MIKFTATYIAFCFILPVLHASAQEKNVPFQVAPLFDLDKTETLGLPVAPGLETITIFTPAGTDNKYNNGAVLYPFKDQLYAQWQSSAKDEDGDDTQVFYSFSSDGKDWCEPMALSGKWDKGIKTSGGWWSFGDTLVAFINVWPQFGNGKKEGYTQYLTSADGINWSAPRQVMGADGKPVMGIIEQDLHALPGGRIITAFHMQPGLTATPFYTDDQRAIAHWKAGEMDNLPTDENMSREIEPAWFYRKDGAVVMIFRDQNSTFKKLAAMSLNDGETWTTPVVIDTPDSRAKQSAGNLPDGTAFMVNNPSATKKRYPLAITLSKEGFLFDKAFLLRSGYELPALQYEGKYKRRGYHYPKSVVWGDYLYVSYATNKEKIELTRIPVSNLQYNEK